MRARRLNKFVFINCPFDPSYQPLLSAITFTVLACGFRPRCALEEIDSGEIRLLKIIGLIEQCDSGIHDISCTTLNAHGLPRFNMPFELGLFLGCKHFGKSSSGVGANQKRTLILDRERYRYQQFLSDLSGNDPEAHQGDPLLAISCVRDWLANQQRKHLAGPAAIQEWFTTYSVDLPRICEQWKWSPHKLTFQDLVYTMKFWLETAMAGT